MLRLLYQWKHNRKERYFQQFSICSVGYAHENTKGRLKPVRRLSDDLSFTKTTRGQSPTTVNSTYRRLQNSSAENAKRPQLIIATTSGVGRILESDILGIAAMNCNDGSVKGFVGYKYPTYACYACYTSNLKFVPSAGSVWRSHARGWCRYRLRLAAFLSLA